MPRIIAILFEKKKEESYIAIELEGENPEILFTKGPSFEKRMGPFPEPYARATCNKWNYCRVENPPEVLINDTSSLSDAIAHLHRKNGSTALFSKDTE